MRGGNRFNCPKGIFNPNPVFILDQERAKKLNPGALSVLLGRQDRQVRFGVGGLVKLRPEYAKLSWEFGIPTLILEEMLYSWSGEIKSVARSLGREVNSPDQLTMVRGVAQVYGYVSEAQRARGAQVTDPPLRTKEILEEAAVLGPGPKAPVKKNAVVILGTSNFRNFVSGASNVKVIVQAIPGYDYTKGGEEERVESALQEAENSLLDYWGSDAGSHKVVAVYLGLYGNGSLFCEKRSKGVWVVSENAFSKPTIRARGYKRALNTEIVVELAKKRFSDATYVTVPPLPRMLSGFGSASLCLEYFKCFQQSLSGMSAEMEVLSLDVMGQVDEGCLAGLLGPDQIHWSDRGRALVKAVIDRHIVSLG